MKSLPNSGETMERIYTFDARSYQWKVVNTGYILIVILAYSTYMCIASFSYLWLLFAGVSLYGILNTFVTKSNPRRIIITDQQITFRSFGEKKYQINELTKFRMRTSVAGCQVYLLVNDKNRNEGRFWVNYSLFNDKADLLKEFDYLERKVQPDALRFQGRPELGRHRPQPLADQQPLPQKAAAGDKTE
jgi:hypothetical protein